MPLQNQTAILENDVYDRICDLVQDSSLEQVLTALVHYAKDWRDDDLSQIPAKEKAVAQKLINQLNEATDTAEELAALFAADTQE